MILKSFFSFIILCFLFAGTSFANNKSLANSSLSPDKTKAREAVLVEIKKRQAELESIKQKRAEKAKKRQMAKTESMDFTSEKILARETLRQAAKIKAMKSPAVFSTRSKPMAEGLILEFSKWPPAEEEILILKKLKEENLKEDAKLNRFKMWIYKWTKAHQIAKAEKLCKDFLTFQSIKSCEPDSFLEPVQSESSEDELYEKQLEKAKKGVEDAKKDVEDAKKDVEDAKKDVEKFQGYVDRDRAEVESAEQEMESAEQSVERARQSLEMARERNNGVEEAEKRLKDREKLLEDNEKWLESMKKQLESSEKQLKDSEKWLEESEKWLENREKWLENREKWLEEVKSRAPKSPKDEKPEEPPKDEKPETPTEPETVDLRSCNILSSNFNLNKYSPYLKERQGSLSDYWAQEMVGADLLKKEIQKAPAVKKHLVELFDSHAQNKHDYKVRNIISDEGKHSVLPELGDSIGISQSDKVSDFLKHSDQLLNKVDKVCGTPPSESNSNPSQ